MKKILMFGLTLLLSLSQAQTYVELILDASGSMWNKLDDGRYRIVAAKDVLTQFIGGLPDGDLNVGLRVYGSQIPALEEGACDDTELFVPLAGLDKAALSQTVQQAEAIGATPIAKSLLAAADDFPIDASRRLIILVTDGEESCGGDLQAVAEDLRSRGFEIDIRIIGFDLDAKAIESFEGIGSFENAESAQELAQALETAVQDVVTEAQPTACDASASLSAPASVEASYPFSIPFEGPEGRISLHPVGGDEFSALDSAFSEWGNPAELTAPGEAGSYELRYTLAGNCLIATAELMVTPIEASLISPERIEGGYRFPIDFSGPEGRIAIFKPEDSDYRNYNNYSFYVTQWNNKELLAPSEPGSYEVRYYDSNGVLLTSNTLEVSAAQVSLTSPDTVEAGYVFVIDFSGPEGRIAIFKPEDSDYRNYNNYSFYVTQWNNKELLAPSEPGSYEVRYYDSNGVLLASNTLEVSASLASLNVPDSVEAGYTFTFEYSGPEGRIAIFKPEDTDYRNYNDYSMYVTAWNNRELLAPSEPGMYEVRYYDDNQALLLSRSIEVLPVQASLTVPASIEAGYKFSFEYSGPEGRIAIFKPEDTDYRNYNDYSMYVTAWNNRELLAPGQPGMYEVRYYDENQALLVTQPLEVSPTTASLTVPAEVTAGEDFSFEYSGPDGRIAIFLPGDTNYRNYNDFSQYVTAWNTVKLTAPESPGTYEVRYYDENQVLMVSQTITVK